MAAPQYDMEQMIANIKRRCAVPTSQLTYTDEDFTELCNDEMQGEVVPLLMSTREEYFVDYVDIPAPSDNILPLPNNTVASKVRSVCYVQQSSPTVLVNLPRIDLDIVAGVGFANYQTLMGFYIQGNDLYLYPDNVTPAGTVFRIYYYRRTLDLAPPSLYGQIMSIDTNLSTVVLDFVPTSWVVGDVLNAVSSTTPFRTTSEAMEIVTLSSPTIELDTVEDLSVGDYVSLQGYSAVPQILIEAHAYLAQKTAALALEGLGDERGAAVASNKAESLKSNLLTIISNRVDGSTKKIMNPSGGLRVGVGLGRWGRGWSGGVW